MNARLKISAMVACAAVALTGCSEDLTAITGTWSTLQSTMTTKLGELTKLAADLKGQAAGLAVEADDKDGADLKGKVDGAVANLEGSVGGLKGIIEGLQPKIAEAIKGGKIAGVQSVIDAGKAEFDAAVAKIDTKGVEGLIAGLKAHIAEVAAKKAAAAANPETAVAADAAPVVDAKKAGNADFFYSDFEAGTDKLKTEGASTKANLEAMVSLLNSCKEIVVEVQGHTSKVGDEKANKLLSAKRAQAITRYLVDKNKISPSKIRKTIGIGSDEPAMEEPAPGSDAEKAMDAAKLADIRARNERIRLKILTPCK